MSKSSSDEEKEVETVSFQIPGFGVLHNIPIDQLRIDKPVSEGGVRVRELRPFDKSIVFQ